MGCHAARTALLWVVAALVVASFSGCLSTPRSSSHGFLSADPYSKLVVEIDSVEGKSPRSSAVALLQQRINERLSKPGGVTVFQDAIAGTGSSYSLDGLRALESQHRDHHAQGDTMALYILYVNGHSDQDTSNGKVLGVHYGTQSLALFKDSIDGSGPLGLSFGVEDVERSVLIHEFGHVLGLVNNGLKMTADHEDPEHPKHSTNKDSVMYWAVENTLGLPLLSNGPPNQFDASDVEDIRGGGGK